jgi:hypothetical protein
MYDEEERDDEEREYTREDHEADEADRKIKEMKIDGTYWAWRDSHLPYPEFQRRQLEDEYEQARQKQIDRALEEEWCNGCRLPRSMWGPICGGMTSGDMTHYHSPEFWRAKAGV